MSYRLKKGDRVKVWSLQSFNNGGFLNGAPAVVIQDQTCDAVILAVVRNFAGTYKVDKSYEVYARQCELITNETNSSLKNSYIKASSELEEFANQL